MILRAVGGVGPLGRLEDAVEGVVREVADGAARFLADEPHGLELVEEVGRALVEVEHAVHGFARRALAGRHQGRMLGLQREVVGYADAGDPRREQRLVGDALDLPSVDEYAGG